MKSTLKNKYDRTKQRLELYYEAETAVLAGQRYKIGTRELWRPELPEIRKMINVLENQCSELESQLSGKGARRAFRITPRDI